jgi:hypothetical protein
MGAHVFAWYTYYLDSNFAKKKGYPSMMEFVFYATFAVQCSTMSIKSHQNLYKINLLILP